MTPVVFDPETRTLRRATIRERLRHVVRCPRCRRAAIADLVSVAAAAALWLVVLNLVADVEITTRLVVAILVAEIAFDFARGFVGAAVRWALSR